VAAEPVPERNQSLLRRSYGTNPALDASFPAAGRENLNQAGYYAQLEQGARHLAALSEDGDERRIHLGWANRYCRLRMDAAQGRAMTASVAA
jgi:hypothetical protein